MGFGDGSGISWTICKQSAPQSRQITTSTPHHSVFTGWMLFLTLNQQCQITEGSFRLVYTISKQTARACQAHGQPNKVLHASMLSQVTGGRAGQAIYCSNILCMQLFNAMLLVHSPVTTQTSTLIATWTFSSCSS